MQSVSEAPDWMDLLSQTRAALTHLRAEELEALALRAEEMMGEWSGPADHSQRAEQNGAPASGRPRAALAREHGLLGDLLAATGENLRVLRRARGAEGGSRWAL